MATVSVGHDDARVAAVPPDQKVDSVAGVPGSGHPVFPPGMKAQPHRVPGGGTDFASVRRFCRADCLQFPGAQHPRTFFVAEPYLALLSLWTVSIQSFWILARPSGITPQSRGTSTL